MKLVAIQHHLQPRDQPPPNSQSTLKETAAFQQHRDTTLFQHTVTEMTSQPPFLVDDRMDISFPTNSDLMQFQSGPTHPNALDIDVAPRLGPYEMRSKAVGTHRKRELPFHGDSEVTMDGKSELPAPEHH